MGSGDSKIVDPRFHLLGLKETNQKYDHRIQAIVDPSQKTKDELIQTVYKSYYGDEKHAPERGHQWVFQRKFEEEEKEETDSLVQKKYQYYAKFIITYTLKNGFIYAIKDENSGEIAGVACMFPPGSIKKGQFYTCGKVMSTLFSCGFPKCERNKEQEKKNDKRCEGFFCKTQHGVKEYANMPHWNLHCLAIKPEYQGMGYGKALSDLMISFSDKDNTPCYLQCTGDVLIKYFENKGFQMQESFHFKEKQNLESQNEYNSAYMIRWPQTKVENQFLDSFDSTILNDDE